MGPASTCGTAGSTARRAQNFSHPDCRKGIAEHLRKSRSAVWRCGGLRVIATAAGRAGGSDTTTNPPAEPEIRARGGQVMASLSAAIAAAARAVTRRVAAARAQRLQFLHDATSFRHAQDLDNRLYVAACHAISTSVNIDRCLIR